MFAPILVALLAAATQVQCRFVFTDIDCKVSPWSDWTSCSEICGGGSHLRWRKIIRSSVGKGLPCPDLDESQTCNEQPCDVPCRVSSWGDWSSCSSSCGGGSQSRKREISQSPVGNGQTCPILEQARPCSANLCDVDCQVGQWSEWSSCSVECGGGTQGRWRDVIESPVSNGQSCPKLEENQACNQQPCDVPCKVSEWSDWSSCSVSCGDGVQSRERTIIQQAVGNTPACPTLDDTRSCQHICDVPCKLSEWSDWSSCSAPCGGGKQTRWKDVIQQPVGVSQSCPIRDETRPCNTDPCDVPCDVSSWSDWSPCSSQCGGGSQSRFRKITQSPVGGGQSCPVLDEVQSCNPQPCDSPCKVSDWSDWTQCDKDCGGGIQSRWRKILSQPIGNGDACPVLDESRPCNSRQCDVPCQVSDWSSWTACSSSCGSGVQNRWRKVTQSPVANGESCPVLDESRSCSSKPCDSPCKVSMWSEWTSCSSACGEGRSFRWRKVTQQPIGPSSCPILDQIRTCQGEQCDVPCQYSEWSDWSECSGTCNGVQYRSRGISSPSTQHCSDTQENQQCSSDC